ncbi:hypothetical protein BDM02DRAFT_3184636 [Thelephora ganbajun]|uniref:Uncharacterized protein n=1 Tax=Thelephora ganbajun TaxID=370292 RepID=A0ACB6ZPZ1_THEGA|nr:hypothetical protein BDM02DRAFT_3184636 [Thelephora ganbajun]
MQHGLFILDLDTAMWGGGKHIYPTTWLFRNCPWPNHGVVDIIEDCLLDSNASVAGAIHTLNDQPNLICDGDVNYDSGRGSTDWNRATYGSYYDP